MSAGKARLTAAAIVFVAWLIWLMVLALTAGKPEVVSRPQFLVADLYVVAELRDDKDPPRAVHARTFVLGSTPQPGLLTSLPWAALVKVPVEVVGAGASEEVTVKAVLRPTGRGSPVQEGEKLFVRNLRLCDRKYGWEGPGAYILALTEFKTKPGSALYQVTRVPASPGYPQAPINEKVNMAPAPIYADTAQVRKQVEYVITAYHGK